jgi:ribosomal protein S18 acetylase RimI-like enzyme
MNIRRFREEDREALHRITVETFGEVSMLVTAEELFGRPKGKSWQSLKKAQIDDDCAVNPDGVLVAVEGDEVIGFATTRLNPDTGIGQIPNIAVALKAQGKGIGTALIHAAIDYLRDRGMTHVRIETLEQNEAAKHLYPKLGFREIAYQIHYMMEIPPGNKTQ